MQTLYFIYIGIIEGFSLSFLFGCRHFITQFSSVLHCCIYNSCICFVIEKQNNSCVFRFLFLFYLYFLFLFIVTFVYILYSRVLSFDFHRQLQIINCYIKKEQFILLSFHERKYFGAMISGTVRKRAVICELQIVICLHLIRQCLPCLLKTRKG